MTQAEARLLKFSFFNKTAKYEEASELFKKAANQYKVAQAWQEAGGAFSRAAECFLPLNQQHDAATCYMDAAVCMKKTDMDKAVEYYEEAISLFCDMGKFVNAAKIEKELGEIFETLNDEDKAVKHFKKAADYFQGEDNSAMASQCLLKVAHFMALKEQYSEAIEIYESVAQACLEKNVLKFNAKGHLFSAGILRLCQSDIVAMKQQLERYKEMDYSFDNSRECKLLEALTEDVENTNAEDFTGHVFDYNSISPLDRWKVSMLLRVKKTISGDDDDDGSGLA